MSIMSGSGRVDPNMLAQTISSNIQRITLLTNEIQQMMRHFGTAQDTTDLRQTLQEKQQKVNQLAKVTDKCMKDFSALPVTTEQRQRKIQRERLITEFSNALAVFQKAQREAAKKEKEFVARVRASSRVSVREMLSWQLVHAQTQSYDEAIAEEDLQLIQERESAIRQLESDITDINEIFRDLGMMVHEQGDMIDILKNIWIIYYPYNSPAQICRSPFLTQRQRKIQRERLITEFSNALAVFQKAQREAAKKEKEFVARVRASSRVSVSFICYTWAERIT
uniref:Syntaxin-7 n=2 Tax=Sinocyclocheilus TaxID=75365 RepID=A0A671S3H8_9TELE